MAALDRERRDKLIKRIDDWLLQEDRAWPGAAPDQRVQIIDALLTYGQQAGMACERDYAVFCRGAILMRAEWQAFVEAEPQKKLLLDPAFDAASKLRAFFNRCQVAARARSGASAGGGAR